MIITYSGITFDLPASMIPQDGQAMVTFLDEAARIVREILPSWFSSGLVVNRFILDYCREEYEQRRKMYDDVLVYGSAFAAIGEVTGEHRKMSHQARHPMSQRAWDRLYPPKTATGLAMRYFPNGIDRKP